MRSFLALPVGLCLLMSATVPVDACTVAVVSGKCTKDGRPLLWKHRDTDHLRNIVWHFNGPKHSFIGIVDADDMDKTQVWVGTNSAGFAIMNSASYNLILKDTIRLKDQEGVVMKRALGQCATLADFEQLLRDLSKPLGVEANFGVIDAQGGAAFYEVDNFSFRKLDVNDPVIAPLGYLVHTNFSFTGDPERGAGHIRFATAQDLFFAAEEQGRLDEQFILQEASRCLVHSLTKTNLWEMMPPDGRKPQFVYFEDYIPRNSTAASVVIQGVKKGEPVDLVTMWTILGSPLTSIAMPLWLSAGPELPRIVLPDKSGNAPLCNAAMQLKERLFPLKRSYGSRYMNLSALINEESTGILQRLRPLEDRIFREAQAKLAIWRTGGNAQKEMREFYRWIDEMVWKEYGETGR